MLGTMVEFFIFICDIIICKIMIHEFKPLLSFIMERTTYEGQGADNGGSL